MLAYLGTRFTREGGVGFPATGLALLVAVVGFGAVGFLDDFMKVRNRRSLGLTKLQKFGGTALVSVVFGLIVSRSSDATGISTNLSFIRPTALALGAFFLVWVFLVLTGTSHAVNLTDGLDGLAAGLGHARVRLLRGRSRSGSSATCASARRASRCAAAST